MSVKLSSLVWEIRGIEPSHKLVLLCLADMADKGGACWPSVPEIAARCGYDSRTISRALGVLKSRGLIDRENRTGKRAIYHFNTPLTGVTPGTMSPPAQCHPTPLTGVTPTPDIDDNPPYITPLVEEPSKNIGDKKLEIPEWVPNQPWEAWIEMRKKKDKKAFTTQAQKLGLTALEKLRAKGYDPEAVINQSILCSWKSFFPLRDEAFQKPTNESRGFDW